MCLLHCHQVDWFGYDNFNVDTVDTSKNTSLFNERTEKTEPLPPNWSKTGVIASSRVCWQRSKCLIRSYRQNMPMNLGHFIGK